MANLIESLESRTFLSASFASVPTDVQDLQSHFKTLKSDVAAELKAAAKDVKTLTADARATGTTKTNRPLISTFSKDSKTDLTRLQKDTNTYITILTKDMKAAAANVRKLQHSPRNAVAQANLTAEIAAIQSDNSVRQAPLNADALTADNTVQADLAAIGAANTDAQTTADVTTAKGHSSAVGTTLAFDLSAINGLGQTLVTDLGG